ncbi:MAG TPA: AlkA N-terminal domain-containing protein [Solirubrobacteraceae bacterium]|nr:AlkA N-terminal domain-containing protein [Solirubrobacteraceae bacterium]
MRPRDLHCRLPLHAPSLLAFFAARAVGGVEEVDGVVYRRSVRLPHGPGVIALDLGARHPGWRLERGDPRDAAAAAELCGALLDADADPDAIDAALAADPLLSALVAGAPGRRVPGCVDPAEIAVRAVLGQQVSVAAARTQAARLTERCGERLPEPSGAVTHLFPTPSALAALDPEELPMPRARGRALVAMAAALAGGLDPRDRAAFLELRGVGPWTADYVAMRCGDRDVLLETDLGVRRGFARLGDPGALVARAEAWRPWRSYAVQHLWSLA